MKTGTLLASRYTIRETLGQGLFGTAHLADDAVSGMVVTVKTIPPQVNGDERELADFKRNFALLHSLDHPNIAKVHSLEADPAAGGHFLVTEHVDGINLQEHRLAAPGERLEFAEALEICRRVAEALDHAQRSILHRDLRPENIMITQGGEIKLLNFTLIPEALATAIRTETARRDPQITPQIQGYMAPEQFFGFPPPGPSVDRYALAVVFYELISGVLPFDIPDSQGLMHAVCNTPPLPLARIGKRRNQVLMEALSKDPGNRFPTAMAFHAALDSPASFALPQNVGLFTAVLGISALAAAAWLHYGVPARGRETAPPLRAETGPPPAQPAPPSKPWPEPRTGDRAEPPDPATTAPTPTRSGPVAGAMATASSSRQPAADPPVSAPVHEPASSPATAPPSAATETGTPRPEPPREKSLVLRVESRPAGAALFLEDEQLGATPFTKGRVKPGTYTLRLEKDGYLPMAMEVELTQDTIIDLSLDPVTPESDGEPDPGNTPEPLEIAAVMPDEARDTPPATALARNDTTETDPDTTVDRKEARTIERLLDAAERDLEAARLTMPPGGNALEKFRAVQRLSPGHPEAARGLVRIADRFAELAQVDIQEWRLSRPAGRNALEKLQTARLLDPHNPQVQAEFENLVGQYLLLARKRGRNAAQIAGFLDQAEAILPDDPRIATSRRELLDEQEPPASQARPSATPDDAPEPATVAEPEPEPAPVTVAEPEPEPAPVTVAEPEPEPTPEPARAVVEPPPSPPTGKPEEWREPLTGMRFVRLDRDCFQMGSVSGDGDEEPAHRVCLDPFWIGRHEVTQGAWNRIMTDTGNPSRFARGDDHPVDTVSWEDAQAFIKRLNTSGKHRFRLPTEAEWEYACRAGTHTPFHFGLDINSDQANFNGRQTFNDGPPGIYRRSTTPVGRFPPNAFGLHDFHGNLYEWVADRYESDYYGRAPERNPIADNPDVAQRVLRGGSWFSNPRNVRCAYRYRSRPELRNHGNGFRLVWSQE